MKKFKVEIDWSGYSRGCSVYEVEAETQEEAEELWDEGEKITDVTVRDDRESEVTKITEITQGRRG